jgi:hypothetical protein
VAEVAHGEVRDRDERVREGARERQQDELLDDAAREDGARGREEDRHRRPRPRLVPDRQQDDAQRVQREPDLHATR